MSIQQQVETVLMRGAMALPERVQRLLGGRAKVIDGQTLAPETQLILAMMKVGGPAAETVPIPQGREIIEHQCRMSGGSVPIGSVRDLDAGGVPARLYSPEGAGSEPTGLLVFFHGGGFMYGGLESHDASCRALAQRAGVRVLAVDYRLAPEHPFPAAYDDAVTAYTWVVGHTDELGADQTRLAVGGDSAGGNLAAGVALVAALEDLPLAFQLLVYPVTDSTHATRSAELFGRDFFLSTAFMDLATSSYLPEERDRLDPRASPAYAEIPEGLAPAYVATAGFDPLRDEGEAYARRLAEAGVPVDLRRFPDQIHSFFNVVGVGRRSPAAVAEIADRLGRALAGRGTPLERFTRMGEAYLAFAEEEPGYYAAIFETRGLPAGAPNPEAGPRPSPFDLLVDALQSTFPEGFGGVAPRFVALEVWALSHGLATLAASGHLPKGPGVPDKYELLRAGVLALVHGAGSPRARD